VSIRFDAADAVSTGPNQGGSKRLKQEPTGPGQPDSPHHLPEHLFRQLACTHFAPMPNTVGRAHLPSERVLSRRRARRMSLRVTDPGTKVGTQRCGPVARVFLLVHCNGPHADVRLAVDRDRVGWPEVTAGLEVADDLARQTPDAIGAWPAPFHPTACS
jgi:hypothetical protein